MHPELSGEEQETAGIIAARLRALGLRTETGIGGYGVVGVLDSNRAGPTIAYRADMDALPMQDALVQPYASMRLGVSHACGHDVHVTIALGLAELLSRTKERLRGRVVFVFQPAEESLDGARTMLDAGLFQSYPPDLMLALHTFPIPVGTVGVATAACLAGMEEFRVRLYTPAGNLRGLIAHVIENLEALSTDAVPTEAQRFAHIIQRMREGDPELGRTIFLSSWPHAPGDTSHTHVLSLVSIADFSIRPEIHARIEQTLDTCTASFGATYDIDYTFSNPPLRNDGALIDQIIPAIEQALGSSAVLRFRAPYPFAHEDFVHYAERVPAAFLWLGTQNLEKGIPSILHTPDYDVDEDALITGVTAMAAVIRRLMGTD
jgi:amidohydrolase